MRLICPNCEAQYEVPDDVIPEDGRDVQCSNCGNTWFQQPASAQDDAEEDSALYGAPEDVSPAREAVAPVAAEPAPETPAERRQRRQLDPEIANVLREEAEHEARARAAESGSLETQPDLGLDDGGPSEEAEKRAQQARERMARMRGTSVDDGDDGFGSAAVSAAAAAAGNTRRDMLPDIEEINSTLRSSSEPRAAETQGAIDDSQDMHRARGGFRRGFTWVILLAVLAVAVYLYADRIAEMVPQAAGPLESYVALVDDGRAWLDAKVLQGLQWLDSMSSEAATPADAPGSN
ncbi:zinc-ribbon domain-containing protein [Primorskyibacter aestuariivivens]|uniref:zinc-ribbon domain-containing protein n=1 Tax=Primorskyibacter aestuariivivens TaxID=1888912 RepID=UPI00230076C0|nr:zinc-ribbon domain-containing protein [Primorskyibacter aestuariivivens]MDA7427244.1 zinc-ribbon domain-containing protein [Primorskyibacter aestuariivivens]